jgi:DNA polymerase-3 subunit delta
MPRYSREEFDKVLKEVEESNVAPLYLLHGESYLVKSALGQLTDLLIPESQRNTNLEVVDGGEADFRRILDSVNTFALFGGRKVVVVADCRVFYSRTNLPELFVSSKEAYDANDLRAAARLLLEVLGYAGWSLEDVGKGGWREIPAHIWEQTISEKRDETQLVWLEEVIEHAISSTMEVPQRGDDATLLETALSEGFPPDQSLLLTTDTVDKRRSLYRLMEEKAVVIDFSVASGISRKDRSRQAAVLIELVKETLSAAGKSIEPEAVTLLLERTGFNLWALKSQTEKLVSFLGDEERITIEQVEGLTDTFREEALYELNNAVASRDCAASIAVLTRLLDQGYGPLQIIGSLANEVRRLLLAREFIDNHLEGGLEPRISYGSFQKRIYPEVKSRLEKESLLSGLHPFALHKTTEV